ncbi:MAG TPA: 30S ribosomal protein S8 [Planctomycetota bacterium]|jgi:small subunit ribosomal protein S8|nr:30S ribosomal protein S8 [Planctomycetota bacterium]
MTNTDPIADFLTRLRNGASRRFARVDAPLSRAKVGIAIVLKKEGYIRDFEVLAEPRALRVHLKYGPKGESAFRRLDRLSRPGRRLYAGRNELPRPLGGLGVTVVSTPLGILSSREARERGVGGEVLALVC